MTQDDFKGRIASIQWNNRLKTNFLYLWFLGSMVFMSLLLLIPVIGIMALIDPNSIIPHLEDGSILFLGLKFVRKIFFFTIAGVLLFIYRDYKQIEEKFDCKPLTLPSNHDFYKHLETLCISRGVTVPDLYIFTRSDYNRLVTAVTLHTPGKKQKAILTEADLALPLPLQESLAAQIVQRIHTKDTLFFTLFCFLGYFPTHLEHAMGKVRYTIFKPFLKTTEMVMKPFRQPLLEWRLARMDVGSLELTKLKGPARELINLMPSHQTLAQHFHDPYIPLFLSKSDAAYRLDTLTQS